MLDKDTRVKLKKTLKLKRGAFANAKRDLIQFQKTLTKPPKRKKLDRAVDEIIAAHSLTGTGLERYFRLYATCALLNQEALCRNWKRIVSK